jgi:hypothetical protein
VGRNRKRIVGSSWLNTVLKEDGNRTSCSVIETMAVDGDMVLTPAIIFKGAQFTANW